jgi:hypothetical protein
MVSDRGLLAALLHLVSVTFALNLALAPLVPAFVPFVPVSRGVWVGLAPLLSLVVAVALRRYPAIDVDGVWHFGLLVFALAVGLHAVLFRQVPGGAGPLAALATWLLAVGAVGARFRERIGTAMTA